MLKLCFILFLPRVEPLLKTTSNSVKRYLGNLVHYELDFIIPFKRDAILNDNIKLGLFQTIILSWQVRTGQKSFLSYTRKDACLSQRDALFRQLLFS